MTDVRDEVADAAANDSGRNPSGSFIWYELMTPDPDGAKAFYDAVVGWNIERRRREFQRLSDDRPQRRRHLPAACCR